MTEYTKPRPEFRNIHALSDLPSYRMTAAAYVSILHRLSGVLMFLLLPWIVWMFDTSVSSEISYARFTAAFQRGIGFVPAFMVKFVVLVLAWAYLHHFFAGLRHLCMDLSHAAVSNASGRRSGIATLVLSLGLSVVVAAKLFGLY
jgi:succinate dehydrogenase / fumarate reductase, cytochrome b subunit